MSDNLWRPGDADNKILQKILATLQFGLVTPSNTVINNSVSNATTNSSTSSGTPVTGNVGGFTTVARAQPTCTASSAYSTGNNVGGLITLTNFFRAAGTGILESIILADSSNQSAAMSVLIFTGTPVGQAGFAATDKVAFTFGNAILLLEGIVNIGATDYTVINSTAIAMKTGLGIAIRGTGQAFYAALVTTGTPTWATTTPLNLFFGGLID